MVYAIAPTITSNVLGRCKNLASVSAKKSGSTDIKKTAGQEACVESLQGSQGLTQGVIGGGGCVQGGGQLPHPPLVLICSLTTRLSFRLQSKCRPGTGRRT